jgi:hypothetical protein
VKLGSPDSQDTFRADANFQIVVDHKNVRLSFRSHETSTVALSLIAIADFAEIHPAAKANDEGQCMMQNGLMHGLEILENKVRYCVEERPSPVELGTAGCSDMLRRQPTGSTRSRAFST